MTTTNSCTLRGSLYVVTSDFLKNKGIYKIGYTTDFNRRLWEINAYAPVKELQCYPVVLTENINCVNNLERELHEHFQLQLCENTMKREWFHLTPQCIQLIELKITQHLSNASACTCRLAKRQKIEHHIRQYVNERARLALVQHVDVEQWVSPTKLTLKEVCAKFDLDIENDHRNRVFWNINITQKVLVNDDVLDFIGYAGSYKYKKYSMTKLLKKNPHIEYSEIKDEENSQKKYYVLSALDFESIMMQMRTPKIIELRYLFSLMKFILTKYNEYEKCYEKSTVNN